MDTTPEQLAARLEKGPLAPAYLVAGPEPLRVLEGADAVRKAARAQGIQEREVFQAEGNQREPDWGAMAASLRAPGLFAARRLLELRLPTGKPGTEGSKLLVEYCSDPPADICLLVTCGEWSKSHGGKWADAIARIGVVAIARQVKPHEFPEWLERRLRARGLRADQAAVQQLAERVEGNLLAAAQEIDKLALLSDGQPLDAGRMRSLVADSARFDVFRLFEASLNGQAAQVARILHGLRAEGAAVPALLGYLAMELQRGAALARVQARGGNLNGEFRAQRVWDSRQAPWLRALKRHPPARWERFVAGISQVDRIAKGRRRDGSEPEDAWQQLERVLLALAEPGAVRLLGA